jgi:hypothetical protein
VAVYASDNVVGCGDDVGGFAVLCGLLWSRGGICF